MSYDVKITILDFAGNTGPVRATTGYSWTEVGGQKPVEQFQDQFSLDLQPNQFVDFPFSLPVNLAPVPHPAWFTAMRLQEISGIGQGSGWLFRSQQYQDDPPTDPIEVIVAPEQLVGNAEIVAALPALPITRGSTTVTSITAMVSNAMIDIVAGGTDTRLPAGVTFTFTASIGLSGNDSIKDSDLPLIVQLTNPNIAFTAGPGTGFITAILNAVHGLIEDSAVPSIHALLTSTINAGVIARIGPLLGRPSPATLPPGVILSVRRVRGTSRTLPDGTTEPVLGVFAALGAFGGVANKFPATANPRPCFIATAAAGPDDSDVMDLRAFRDERLVKSLAGRKFIAAYDRLSPPVANYIATSSARRALVRHSIVMPLAAVARLFNR